MPLGGVFHRIAQQVHQDLPQLNAVGDELAGASGVSRVARLQSPRPGAGLDHGQAFLDQMPHVDAAQVERRSKRLDPGIVEHDIDHVAHVLAGADDLRNLRDWAGVRSPSLDNWSA